MKATVEQLAQIGIFARLNRTELERLQEHTAIRTYRQGEVVMHEGDRIPEKLYTMIERFSAGGKNSGGGQRNNSGHLILPIANSRYNFSFPRRRLHRQDSFSQHPIKLLGNPIQVQNISFHNFHSIAETRCCNMSTRSGLHCRDFSQLPLLLH